MINPYKYKPKFKGNDDIVPSSEIDSWGQSVRDYIRLRHEKSVIDQNNGRMSQEELKGTLGKLINHPNVENVMMNRIGLVNLKYIGNDSYAGGMPIVSEPKQLPKLKMLKDAGIRHIIDLDKVEGLEEECKKLGLDYFNFKHINCYSEVCQDSEWYRYGEWHRKSDEFFEKCRVQLDSIIKLVQTMQKGNVYIGCRNGTDFTDCALCLDHLFNPKSKHASYASYDDNYYCYDHYMHGQHYTDKTPNINRILFKFTSNDLHKMGFTDCWHPEDYYAKLDKILYSWRYAVK